MRTDVKRNLRNDWLIQEIIINSVPVPALAYFVWACFPFARESMGQFFGNVLLAVGGCFAVGFAVRKFAARQIVHVVTTEHPPAPEELMAARVQALHFPLIAAAVMFVRWTLLTAAFIFLPLYLQGRMSPFDLFAMGALLLFAAISSLPFCFLCSERALMEFLNIPEIEACRMDDKTVFTLKISAKILLLNLLSIIPLAGNFCIVLVIAHRLGIDLASIKLGFFLLIVQAFGLTLLNGSLLSINIRKFLDEILTFFENLAKSQGDLNRKIVVGSNDELGDLARLFNHFLVNLKKMIVDIKANSDSLDTTSNNLVGLSVRMNERVEISSKTSNAVAAASEEMGGSLHSIFQSMEETAGSVNTVAVSTEEMSSTVNEIAEHSAKARNITESAVEDVDAAKAQVDELGINAHEIDQVTEVISEISEQTNLLALNATIEAARAGEAGKGFSVVANEIKELARQTSGATARIKKMVAAIQNSSTGTIEQINRISGIIKEVNNYVAAIAAAVEEQSNANREIACMVSDVSQKNQQINTKVSQVSTLTNAIVKDIAQVSQSVEGVSEDSKEIRQFGKDISGLSSHLQQMVARFKLN